MTLVRRDGFLKEVMEGRMEEKKPRGKKRMGILEELYKILELKAHCCSHTMGSNPYLLD